MGASAFFLAFYWTIDVLGYRAWALFFTVIGVNALAAYLGPSFVQTHRLVNALVSLPVPANGRLRRRWPTAPVLVKMPFCIGCSAASFS